MKEPISIMLDKERTIKYTLNSLIKFEEITGLKLGQLGQLGKDLGMETILALLYVGLIHEDKKLKLEELGDMITLDRLMEVNTIVMKAFTNLK